MNSADSELTDLDEQGVQRALTLLPQHAGPPKLVPEEVIRRITSRREAYRMCVRESQFSAGEVAAYLGIDEAQFSRILKADASDANKRHLDDDKEHLLELVCGNMIPTQWAAYQRGYELRRRETALEKENRELRERLDEVEREFQILHKHGVLPKRDG